MKNGTSAGGIKSKIFLWSLKNWQGNIARYSTRPVKNLGLILRNKQKIAEKLVFSKIKRTDRRDG